MFVPDGLIQMMVIFNSIIYVHSGERENLMELDHPQWKMIYRSKFGDTVDGRNPAKQLTWKYLLSLLGFQLRFICTAIIYVCYR